MRQEHRGDALGLVVYVLAAVVGRVAALAVELPEVFAELRLEGARVLLGLQLVVAVGKLAASAIGADAGAHVQLAELSLRIGGTGETTLSARRAPQETI